MAPRGEKKRLKVLLNRTASLPIEDALHAERSLEARLGQHFEFELNGSPVPLPVIGYDGRRGQYAAEAFLPQAENLRSAGSYFASLLLTDADIFARSTNYVFGLADIARRVAVVSSCRIHPAFWGAKETREFFEEQWGKVVTHEFGHTLGLLHCSDWDCVMKYSNSPIELYRKGKNFCAKCRKQVERKSAESAK
jgi:archaemetzincin